MAQVGNFTPFSPCSTFQSNQIFSADQLFVVTLTVTTSLTLIDLGVVGEASNGTSGILTLYRADGTNGAPGTLVAQTASTPISAGSNTIQIATSPPPVVAPGMYWIGGEYNGNTSLCVDTSTSNPNNAISLPKYNDVPAPYGASSPGTGIDINYYAVGLE